jgi:hypothetical protein
MSHRGSLLNHLDFLPKNILYYTLCVILIANEQGGEIYETDSRFVFVGDIVMRLRLY